jgi:hypothetical protein
MGLIVVAAVILTAALISIGVTAKWQVGLSPFTREYWRS